MARPYAANADLQVFIPDILGYGVADFSAVLDKASEDVLNQIKANWWPTAVSHRFNQETVDIGSLTPPLDEANINDAALVNLTCYRAFSQYIFPMLTKDADRGDQDSFAIKMDRYAKMFETEWTVVKMLPLYDFNGDSAFTDIERRGPSERRLRRA